MSFDLESRAPGVWGYAVRAESWSLIQTGFLEWKLQHGSCPPGELRVDATPVFAVNERQMASLITTVSHVVEYQQLPPCRQQSYWTVTTGIGHAADVAGQLAGIDASLAEDVAVIEGPVITYNAGAALQLCQSIEIEYRHTPALLTALLDTLPSIAPPGVGGSNCELCGDQAATCDWCAALAVRQKEGLA